MKKILALGIAIAMLFIMAIPATAVNMINYTAPSGTPALDGVKDNFYGEWIPINTIHSFDGTETGATGKFAFAWDATAIYIIAEVVDTTPNHEHNDAHQRDSVEVFFDWYNTGVHAETGEGPFWLIRLASDPDRAGEEGVTGFTNNYEGSGMNWGNNPANMGATRATAPLNGSYNNGYIVEAKIPIAEVEGGMVLAEGVQIRFCLAINDNQGEGRATGAYPAHVEADGSWNNAENHGYIMTLAAAPAAGGDTGGGGNEDVVVVTPPPANNGVSNPVVGDSALVMIMLIALLGAAVITIKKVKVK